jgi:hypothetical protein
MLSSSYWLVVLIDDLRERDSTPSSLCHVLLMVEVVSLEDDVPQQDISDPQREMQLIQHKAGWL